MRILITIIIIISTSIIWSQEKIDYKSWNLGINFSPEIGYRYLRTDSKDTMMNYIINQRDNQEIPATMFSSGLSIEYRISKSFSVKSGFHYTLRGEKTKDLGYGSDYNGFGTYIEKMIFKNRYHYIGVPIIGSIYLMNKVKIQLYSSIGVGFDFLYLRASRSTIKIHNEEEENNFQKEKPNDDGFNDYNIFNPSGLLSFGLDLKIGNKSKLRIEPNFKISMLPMVNAPIEGNYYNYGLNIGYIYSLK